ncbi:LysR substrate-binding domain-containing protein [Defluviimonas sp. D31]|uniref:LysR family transcriptional regulator n=1 Tax=Defluviimonas sp. D31 TaxID=3083253 RepID=UPI00296F4AFF|nr:LysR substrate-binding domain-containing protein [Defluviimonas sp. D31]MDW4550304.1 LysR substrate-binding domain-containing protein [Defluviimonas sp. D31]
MDMLLAMKVAAEIAHRGSFTAAGRALGLSPPSVSRIVSELEADLGVRLFNRSTRHVALTEEGQAFFQRGEAILEEIDALREVTRAQHRVPSGQITLSSSVAFGNELLPPAIAGFLARHPEVQVQLGVSNRTVDLIQEHVDIAFRIGVGGLPDSTLKAVRVLDYRLIFVASPGYLSAHGYPADLEELKGRPVVKLFTGSWGHVHTLQTPDGPVEYRLPDAFGVDAFRAQLGAVLAGHGLSLMHDYVAAPEIAAGRLVHVLPGFQTVPQSVFAVYAHRHLMATRIRVFLDFILEWFKGRNTPLGGPAVAEDSR